MMGTDIGWRARRGNSCLGAKSAGQALALREPRTIVTRPALSTISGHRTMDTATIRADNDEAPPGRRVVP
jgi:hypothetical protein